MYPGTHAKTHPEKTAYLMAGSGQRVSYRELDERSSRCAWLLRSLGLRKGDGIAIFMENHPRMLELAWAAQRSGLYYTTISSHLTAPEVAYIVNDCGAKVFFSTNAKAEVAAEVPKQTPAVKAHFGLDGAYGDLQDYEAALAAQPAGPIPDEEEGADMLYSSGTTGRPKGIRHKLPDKPAGSAPPLLLLLKGLYHADDSSVYLSPAPLYHAAPLRFTLSFQRVGATVVVMEHFDARQALALIERHRITHSQWVPTMFVRMLKLAPEERAGFDLSSHRCAIHAAAPCPVPVKQQMIEWWGPILHEYYGGSEGNGLTAIDSAQWLAHKGSVGRAVMGEIHIVDDQGNELPVGQDGTVYFGKGPSFEYHNDPAKTAASRNERGWSTLGDVGHLDAEGYLYLTDRKANMIISGGVNIYPQEIENVLITHPKVLDVAVFGVPNQEFGEEVKAVVQLRHPAEASPALAEELLAFCREHIAHFKCPRSVDFQAELPRHPNGKLYKRLLKDRYWGGHETRIV